MKFLRRFLPKGIGILFDIPARRKLALSVLGSIVLSLIDTLGVLATLPLFQLLAGVPSDQAAMGALSRATGITEPSRLALVNCLVIVVLFSSKSFLSYYFRRWQARLIAGLQADSAADLLRRFLDAPYAFHLERNSPQLLQMINSVVGMGYGYVGAWMSLMVDAFNLVMILAALLVFAPLPAIGAVVYFAITSAVVLRLSREKSLRAGEELINASTEEYRASMRALFSVKEIKLRHVAEKFARAYKEARLRSASAGVDSAMAADFPRYVFDAVFIVGIAVMAVTLFSTAKPSESLVLLGLFAAAGMRIMPAISRMLGSVNALRVGGTPVRQLIEEQHALREAEAAAPSLADHGRQPVGDIEVDRVSFSYASNPELQVLNDVSLTIPEGTSLALVGASGAGKSTLVDVLLGLHIPSRGHVRVGGEDILANLRGWQDSLAVVPQDVWLSEESVRANIAFGQDDHEVDEHLMRQAAEDAQLTETINGLRDGFDTWLGGLGSGLSGGQRQRLGIARALYRKPRVLILDEATSALDNKTERYFAETVEALRGKMTLVIVAHRLSTVRHVDQLAFMANGKIRTIGTFEEVARQDPEFAELVRLGGMLSDLDD